MTATEWRDPEFATSWAAQDVLADLLLLPRRIASAIVAQDRPGCQLVVDLGSGPGAFLTRFLEQFPHAAGVWTDVSLAMEELARPSLSRFGDRVTYQIVEMSDLSRLPDGIDVITTSRASHHLEVPALRAFYAAAHAHLAPGGWLVNLDHTYAVSEQWNARLRAARTALVPPPAGPRPEHHHVNRAPTIAEHLIALADAGFTDVEIPWRAFPTCLVMGRRDGS
jgi:SAM-dependent methyltransferase